MPHQCTTCGRTFEDGSKDMLSGCPDCGGNKFQFQPAGAVSESAGNAGANASGGPANAATAPKKTPESARSAGGSSSSADASETGGTRGGTAGDRGASAPETGGDDRASAVNRAAATVRDWVGKRDDARDDRTDSTRDEASTRNGTAPRTDATPPSEEDSAQASARRDVVSESELPDEPPQRAGVSEPGDAPAANSEGNVVSAPDDESPGLKELREELNSQFESIRIVEPGQYELNLMELYEREEYIISLQEDGKYVIEVPDAWDASDR
ncbi:OapC/ArvC family zinc-ribbon domain-containing protein [Halorussus lipolyticus]|uniref:OapC/ArvC family zinc-ribbon domain-containing protein n=1 Tax=Halorussus lipolyticus TaxID=3034024 RepID=UPI0023E77314|nr:Zn-ribbon containing protein [Halorussus sp. DT80]